MLTQLHRQLAVVRGLVINKVQKMKLGKPVIHSKSCRASYGIVCTQPYDKKMHYGQEVIHDEFTGEKLAKDQISWMVVKVNHLSESLGFESEY